MICSSALTLRLVTLVMGGIYLLGFRRRHLSGSDNLQETSRNHDFHHPIITRGSCRFHMVLKGFLQFWNMVINKGAKGCLDFQLQQSRVCQPTPTIIDVVPNRIGTRNDAQPQTAWSMASYEFLCPQSLRKPSWNRTYSSVVDVYEWHTLSSWLIPSVVL